ncbi:lipopolysaccharide transport periplasmic protein LptA [Microbulbifer flavimaris]|uniref:Lipopolysaccharide export system protein LptA n=1 Tax=Microbulbifer flavimaris TaxID=1781068 RepID=A0ABX4I1G4_9GAMM|nr:MULTISPECIES: lipopolysaccharide transport periplasmic protein LptA [Microbulbifer]KUJ83256.1 lipopolysaccharide transporter [Microbulbifer sp. ZGT114]PCO05404.1 lipopolysaccharide transport periplasmic protein LptA [Microbulbifer flavimaris]
MKRNNLLRPLAAVAFLLLSAQALALPEDRNQPIKVDADHFDGNRSKNLFVYSGNVQISQGTLQIRADRVEVHGTAQGEIQKVVATGKPAHFQQQVQQSQAPVKAKASRIEFRVNADELQLSGNAHVDRDGNTLSAEKIDYDLNSEQIEAQGQSGNGRVEMIWQPEKKQAEPKPEGQQAP